MKLTGKAKEDFEKWLKDNDKSIVETDDFDYTLEDVINSFPNSCKYGVYVDWFDSVGITIELNLHKRFDGMWCYFIDYVGSCFQENFKSRQEAREQAILKANEIYNELIIK